MVEVTSIYFEQLKEEQAKLASLKEQRIALDETIKEQEKQIQYTKAVALDISPESEIMRFADGIIRFSEEENISPVVLASLVGRAHWDSVMYDDNPCTLPDNPTDEDYYKQAMFSMRQIGLNRGITTWVFQARELLEQAETTAQLTESDGDSFKPSLGYRYLQRILPTLGQMRRDSNWRNY